MDRSAIERYVRRHGLAATLVYAASGIAAVAGSFLVHGRSPAFVVIAVSEVVLGVIPDGLLAAGILTLGKYGRPLLVAGALGLAIGLFALVALLGVHVTRRRISTEPVPAVVTGAVQALLAFALTATAWGAIASGVAGALVLGLGGLASTSPASARETGEGPTEAVPGRRQLLRSLGAAAAIVGVSWTLAPRPDPIPERPIEDEGVLAMLSAAEERSLYAGGIEPLVSEDFFTVDINTAAPRVDAESWSLRITGTGAETPFSLDYDDLTRREAEHRFVTLRCVSDEINGELMDTALWTGVPIGPLLAEAGAPETCCVRLEAADGYYQAFPRAALERGFLAWRMNGQLLPLAHGHPVRALIPGHWGEINVKWLTGIEIREEPATGYWEERGWHGTGPVETVAKLHSVSTGDGTVLLGGHAYAGTRGVSGVEVSTDGGETWSEAELTTPLPGPAVADGRPHVSGEAEDAWRMWRYEYEATEPHDVVVRAIESDGTVQPEERADPFPSGASGWVTRRVHPG